MCVQSGTQYASQRQNLFDAAAISRSVWVCIFVLTLSKAVFDDLFAGRWDTLRKHHLELDQQVTTLG